MMIPPSRRWGGSRVHLQGCIIRHSKPYSSNGSTKLDNHISTITNSPDQNKNKVFVAVFRSKLLENSLRLSQVSTHYDCTRWMQSLVKVCLSGTFNETMHLIELKSTFITFLNVKSYLSTIMRISVFKGT